MRQSPAVTLWMVTILASATAATSPASAETIPVNFQLDPPTPLVNTLELKATATILGFKVADTDRTTVTGHAPADLSVEVNPAAPLETDINELTFTGGTFNVGPFTLVGDFGFFGTIEASGQNLAGTAATLSPPAPVNNGQFDASDHTVVLNQGIVDLKGTGVAGSLFNPFQLDLAQDPFTATTRGTGTISVLLNDINGQTAFYDTVLTLPAEFSEQVMLGSIPLNITGDVLLEGTGQFSAIVPEPPAIIILMSLLPCLPLARLRRR